MFKKVFSTTAILLLATSSQSAAAAVTGATRSLESLADSKADKLGHDPPGAKAEKTARGNNCAGNLAQEALIKLTLARQFAIQFVGLYSLGDAEGDIEGDELENLVKLASLASGVPVDDIEDLPALADDEVDINEVEAAVLLAWQDTCAAEMKEMLDGTILPRIAGYNADYVVTTPDEDA